ncbi:MAG: DNA-3-methyladenine glycosylase [Calditrichaeota bacterium]|nr:DNA-3-methyladenine glycosylase [Calditrichota bacterium]
MKILSRQFYSRDPLEVAQELIGKILVRQLDDVILKAVISETEAYLGENDSASHARNGPTTRNLPMYGSAGFSYVYFVYGRYHMLNIVTERENEPSAVLIRAAKPLQGIRKMTEFRSHPRGKLLDGPGKICQALNIDKSLNNWDLTCGRKLWLENFMDVPAEMIEKAPRIGIDYAEKKDREALLRFVLYE